MPVHSTSATHLWDVLRPPAIFIIWCFKFSCPYPIKTLLKAKVPTLSTLQWRLCDTAHGAIKELL